MDRLSVTYGGVTTDSGGRRAPAISDPNKLVIGWVPPITKERIWYAFMLTRIDPETDDVEYYMIRINMGEKEGADGDDLIDVQTPDVPGEYVLQLFEQERYLTPTEAENDWRATPTISVVFDVTERQLERARPSPPRQPYMPTEAEEWDYSPSSEESSPSDEDGTEEYDKRWKNTTIPTGAPYTVTTRSMRR